ncbi:MAG: ABC transporter permease subunit [Lachnospiraceae bacterium]|nr:ABC transporter permease subunit [Lachnospiraceae bacterium]
MMLFEWKKIFERRLNVVAMILGYLLIAVCVFVWISQARFYSAETDSYLEGIEAIHADQEWAKGQADIISEEYVSQVIREIQSHGMDLESDDAYVEIIRPLGDFFYFLAGSYTDMSEKYINRNVLMEIDLTDGAHFYERRMGKITDYLNMDFSYGNYKEAEKDFWIQKAENTVTPFIWGNKCIMDMVLSSIAIGFYLLFVIVICTSTVFSSEYESGASSLLLTTRYGKDRLIWFKIVVSVLFTAGYLSFGILSAVGVISLLFGFSGVNLPIQLWNSVIPYNLTIGQMCMGFFALILLIGITITLIQLFFSSKLRSSLATMAVGAAIIIAPAFFPMSKKSGLWNHINVLFPVRAANLKEMLGSFVSYTVGDCVISYVTMTMIVYTVIGIVALLFIKKGFVKE